MSGDNVHSLDQAKRNRDQQPNAAEPNAAKSDTAPAHAATAGSGRSGWFGQDLSKWSMVVSLLSLVLVLIFFFGLTQNVSGVADEVQAVSDLRTQVEGLQALLQGSNQYIAGLDERLNAVESTQAEMVRQAVLQGMLSDMKLEAAALAKAIDDPAQAAKLAQVQELLEQLSVTK